MRDFQKSKVYKWENKFVKPRFNTTKRDVSYLEIIRDYIWSGIGMCNPPKLYIDNMYKTKSTGNRYEIRFEPSMTNEFILVHEMAHSLNLREDDKEGFDIHGPNYVADYGALLVKFYKFDPFYLLHSMEEGKVRVNKTRFFNNISQWG
jgi:hypothetical protein